MKDCGCLDEFHVGPHWRHMDEIDKKKTEEMVQRLQQSTDPNQGILLAHYIVKHELARLQTKRLNLEKEQRESF